MLVRRYLFQSLLGVGVGIANAGQGIVTIIGLSVASGVVLSVLLSILDEMEKSK